MVAAHGPPVELDPATRRWLETEVVPAQRIAGTFRLTGGITNEMIAARTDHGTLLVVRRYRGPSGHVTCSRETALIVSLTGTVAVPSVLAADPDGRVAGVPQSVWEYVDGDRLDLVIPLLSPVDAEAVGHAVGTTLAHVARIGFGAPGSLDGRLVPDGRTLLSDLPAAVLECLARMPAGSARLSGPERERLHELARRSTPEIERVRHDRRLVHMDFNPKNVLVSRSGGAWSVSAVVDWEFAHSGSPLTDVGNMLRFSDLYSPEFTDGFLTGYRDGGGDLPDGWRRTSRALDLFTLTEMTADLPNGPLLDRVLTTLRRCVLEPAHH